LTVRGAIADASSYGLDEYTHQGLTDTPVLWTWIFNGHLVLTTLRECRFFEKSGYKIFKSKHT